MIARFSVRLAARFAALTVRERALVVLAGVLTCAVGTVYGVVLPLGAAFDAARARRAEVAEQADRVMAGLRVLDARRALPRPTDAVPIDQRVAASAQAAGLVLQANQPAGDGQSGNGGPTTLVVIASARAGQVLAWLDALAREGLTVETVTMNPLPDGSVATRATLRRAGR